MIDRRAGTRPELESLLLGPAVEIARSIRERDYSVVEMVEAHLERIAAVNPVLNAVVTLDAEQAMEAARRADAASAGARGALHGLPFTIKDSFDTAGLRSTASTEGRRHHVPAEDAAVVARLRAAGAILIGKSNTPELTMGTDTISPLFGRTCNPYHPDYSPAGSSGGAAAIVAAGGSALDIGSDTGGSIREPAHVCGVVGLKPTAGRVPRTGHAVPPGLGHLDPLTQVGPITRHVADVALALPVISGPDFSDPACAPVPLGDPSAVDITALEVAHFTDNGLYAPHESVAEAARAAAAALAEAGARMRELVPPPLAAMGDLYARLRTGDGGWAVRELLRRYGTEVPSEALERRLDRSRLLDTPAFAATLVEADRFRCEMLSFMRAHDAIVSPTSPHTPWKHGAEVNKSYAEWTYGSPFTCSAGPRSWCARGAPRRACRSAYRSSAARGARTSCSPWVRRSSGAAAATARPRSDSVFAQGSQRRKVARENCLAPRLRSRSPSPDGERPGWGMIPG